MHSTRHTSPMSVDLQLRLVSGWGLQKWRSVPPYGPLCLWNGHFFSVLNVYFCRLQLETFVLLHGRFWHGLQRRRTSMATWWGESLVNESVFIQRVWHETNDRDIFVEALRHYWRGMHNWRNSTAAFELKQQPPSVRRWLSVGHFNYYSNLSCHRTAMSLLWLSSLLIISFRTCFSVMSTCVVERVCVCACVCARVNAAV